jgi:hypothetical protein
MSSGGDQSLSEFARFQYPAEISWESEAVRELRVRQSRLTDSTKMRGASEKKKRTVSDERRPRTLLPLNPHVLQMSGRRQYVCSQRIS